MPAPFLYEDLGDQRLTVSRSKGSPIDGEEAPDTTLVGSRLRRRRTRAVCECRSESTGAEKRQTLCLMSFWQQSRGHGIRPGTRHVQSSTSGDPPENR